MDTGIDDALALLYACASPEAEIIAVTCVAGNVTAQQVAHNTLRVLELAGRSDIEVALGREVPLVRPLVIAPETHGPEGIGYAKLPPPQSSLSARHAADLLIDEARSAPGEVTLITTRAPYQPGCRAAARAAAAAALARTGDDGRRVSHRGQHRANE